MKKSRSKPDVSRRIDPLCDAWEAEVLAPLGGLSDRPVLTCPALTKNHPYWRLRREAVRYGTRRVLEVVTDQKSYQGTIDGDRPEDRKEDLFCAIQDFLNVYTRALDSLGYVSDEYPPLFLGHPFWEMRRQFIKKAMSDFPHSGTVE